MTVTLKHSVLQAMNDVTVTTAFLDLRSFQAGISQTQHILKTSKTRNLKLKLTGSSQVATVFYMSLLALTCPQ